MPAKGKTHEPQQTESVKISIATRRCMAKAQPHGLQTTYGTSPILELKKKKERKEC